MSTGGALLLVTDAAEEVVLMVLATLLVLAVSLAAAGTAAAVKLGVGVGAGVLLLLTTVSVLLVAGVVVATAGGAAAGVVAAAGGAKGVALLPSEEPKPPKLKVELLLPMVFPALLPKPANVKGLAAGSDLAAVAVGAAVEAGAAVLAGSAAVGSTGAVISFLASTGLTDASLGGSDVALGLTESTPTLPKPEKRLGAGVAVVWGLGAAFRPPIGNMGFAPPKLKGEVPPKKDVVGLVTSPALSVVVVTVDAVVLTNGLLWLKLKFAGTGAGAEAATTLTGKLCNFSMAATVAAGLEAVGLASCGAPDANAAA